jgi:membrane protein required for colicin V production
MTPVDWVVLIIMVIAVLGGLMQGFFRSVCSLGGLILGLVVAAWNYRHLAAVFLPFLKITAVADTIAFVLIALLVMIAINTIGNLLAKAFKFLGLGWLDGIAGAVFGFFQGVVLVVICILVIVAFFPEAHWIADAKLPRMFFGACHVGSNLTPSELGERVRSGLRSWEIESPPWMHPGHV